MSQEENPNANDPHDIEVKDHLDDDHEHECGYCGKAFTGVETRIEKTIYGRKWAFCSDECLENFRDASNYTDTEKELDPLDTMTANMKVTITGPGENEDPNNEAENEED